MLSPVELLCKTVITLAKMTQLSDVFDFDEFQECNRRPDPTGHTSLDRWITSRFINAFYGMFYNMHAREIICNLISQLTPESIYVCTGKCEVAACSVLKSQYRELFGSAITSLETFQEMIKILIHHDQIDHAATFMNSLRFDCGIRNIAFDENQLLKISKTTFVKGIFNFDGDNKNIFQMLPKFLQFVDRIDTNFLIEDNPNQIPEDVLLTNSLRCLKYECLYVAIGTCGKHFTTDLELGQISNLVYLITNGEETADYINSIIANVMSCNMFGPYIMFYSGGLSTTYIRYVSAVRGSVINGSLFSLETLQECIVAVGLDASKALLRFELYAALTRCQAADNVRENRRHIIEAIPNDYKDILCSALNTTYDEFIEYGIQYDIAQILFNLVFAH